LHSQGNIDRANTLFRENQRITASERADMLDGSSGSADVTVVSISLCLWAVQELPLFFELTTYIRNISHGKPWRLYADLTQLSTRTLMKNQGLQRCEKVTDN
jgi:hypothetical protein